MYIRAYVYHTSLFYGINSFKGHINVMPGEVKRAKYNRFLNHIHQHGVWQVMPQLGRTLEVATS